ncbi:MAG: diguanylate cyclase [Sulfuricurvum sp.]|nr:diguanylate cyclase [Sulfuricurvum sp.]MDD5386099.1 diguanylate cyclase [Sulfuricurvum sp.]
MRIFLLIIIMITLLMGQDSLQKVSVQLDWKYQFEFAGFIAAKEKGFYRDAGLDVELREYRDGIDIGADVLGGKATYGVYNSSIMVEGGRVKPIVLMGMYFQHSPLIFVARKGIKTPADMVGKTIMGTTYELKYSSLALLLNHFNISPKNTKFVDHTFNIQQFIEGKVDVMSAFRSNQLYELDRTGIEYEIIDPAQYGFMMSAVNLFTSPSEAIKHTDRTQQFIDATNRGWKYALDHPNEMINILLHKYAAQKSRNALKYEVQVTKQLMMTDFYPIGEVNSELTVRTFKQLIQTGVLKEGQKLGRYMFKDIAANSHEKIKFSDTEKNYLLGKKKIMMCVDPEWYPLEAIRGGKHIGIAADVMEIFEKKLGLPIELVPTISWSQSLLYAQQRKCDILSLASSAPARLKYINFTSTYLSIPYVMVTMNEKPFTEDMASLRKEKIGIVKGYSTVGMVKAHYPRLHIVEVKSINEGLSKVESGELYGYVDNLIVVSSYIQKEYTGILKVSSRLEEKDDLSVGVRNDEPLLYGVFEKMVKNLDAAVMQSIYNRWVSTVEEVSWIDYGIVWKFLLIILIFGSAFTWRYIVLKRYNKSLLELSITDKLTGLYNRQKTDIILMNEQKKVSRYTDHHCALMMIDVDNFKAINDTAGHQAGDRVLYYLANIMKTNLRNTDILGRWGGEEFIAILPHTTSDEAMVVAENLRCKVEEFSFGLGHSVTISIGVGEFMKDESVHECVGRVDTALYMAKERGRNKVCQV